MKESKSLVQAEQTIPFDSMVAKRIRDAKFDYRSIPAGIGIHSIHPYPAMFHPRLVSSLLESYSKVGDLVLDPFVGSGVCAVESMALGRRFNGFDINPLALLIAKVRSTPLKRYLLEKHLNDILSAYQNIVPMPVDFLNVNFWFSKYRIESISKLIQAIDSINDESVKNFFKISLSETIRITSYTKPSEFKLVKRKSPCIRPTLSVFGLTSKKNINALDEFYKERKIGNHNTLELRNIFTKPIPIKDESVSLVLTSPPYGDSQTTVAYGQFSRLSLNWFNLPCNVDKESLGAKPIPIVRDLPSNALYDILREIEQKDSKRAAHVYSFYKELYHCIVKLVPKVKYGGHLIFVVGNRTVKDVNLPTDIICANFLEYLGCEHKETKIREIGNKRMPSANSPSNIIGEKSPTMKHEYIVICKRK